MLYDQYKKSDAMLKASEKGVEEFRNARFCCTIHWGLYSLLSKGEWAMFTEKYDIKRYESLMNVFNPIKFDADEWARILSQAGYRTVSITSKHHDGFSMYDTKLSDYKITNSPFKRDPMKELAAACMKYGLKLHFYYSLMDWHHPAYLHDWEEYLKFCHGQIEELCTNYGELGGILLDGFWPDWAPCQNDMEYSHFPQRGDYKFGKLYDMIHRLQPNAVITNNSHIPPLAGEDYQIFELDDPGQNTVGFNTTYVSELPLACWFPTNNSWCYNKFDNKFKSNGTIIRKLLRYSGMGVNLFLNISPTDLGEIMPEEKQLLLETGQWLKENGEAVYGTRPVKGGALEWGYIVKGSSAHYIYLLCYPFKTEEDSIKLDMLPNTLTSAVSLDGEKLELSVVGDEVQIRLPKRAFNPIGFIIKVS